MLLSVGAPLTPAGGSSCNLKKADYKEVSIGKKVSYYSNLVFFLSTTYSQYNEYVPFEISH